MGLVAARRVERHGHRADRVRARSRSTAGTGPKRR